MTVATATLTIPAAGNGLGFTWKKDDGDLPSDTRITQSVDKKTVTIKLLKPEDAGAYQATVTGPGGTLKGGDTMAFADGHVKFIVSYGQYKSFCDGPTASPGRKPARSSWWSSMS